MKQFKLITTAVLSFAMLSSMLIGANAFSASHSETEWSECYAEVQIYNGGTYVAGQYDSGHTYAYASASAPQYWTVAYELDGCAGYGHDNTRTFFN